MRQSRRAAIGNASVSADNASMAVSVRYRTLDAWRGVAALSVLLFHCSNVVVAPEGILGRALNAGWAGVFIFFPISGYCILAAINAPRNGSVASFLTRRWRRIFPPYWASLALASAIALLALPFNHGTIHDVALTPGAWLSIGTLTQGFTSYRGAINPVYWSLCYEEQFYLLMAASLLMRAERRVFLLIAVTTISAAYVGLPLDRRLPGLFLDYWPCFVSGAAVYLWLHHKEQRVWAGTIALLVAGIAAQTGDPGLIISAGSAAAFVLLAPCDNALASTRLGRRLIALGAMSYSLYLIHVPIGGRVVNLLRRSELPVMMIVLAAALASVAAGYLFFRVVEQRWRLSAAPRVARPAGALLETA